LLQWQDFFLPQVLPVLQVHFPSGQDEHFFLLLRVKVALCELFACVHPLHMSLSNFLFQLQLAPQGQSFTVQLPMSAGAAPRPASSKQNINFFIDSSFPEEDHPNKNNTSPTLQKFCGEVKGSQFLGLCVVEGDGPSCLVMKLSNEEGACC
jgi:hypothetical protein